MKFTSERYFNKNDNNHVVLETFRVYGSEWETLRLVRTEPWVFRHKLLLSFIFILYVYYFSVVGHPLHRPTGRLWTRDQKGTIVVEVQQAVPIHVSTGGRGPKDRRRRVPSLRTIHWVKTRYLEPPLDSPSKTFS